MVQLGKYVFMRSDYPYADYYECVLCNKRFESVHAIENHCRYSSRHAWCERCDRVFDTDAHKQNHVETSSAHNICTLCSYRPDFASRLALEEHWESYHQWCPPCNHYFESAVALRQHDINAHNMCNQCDGVFQNENNLRMHKRKHEPSIIECCGCTRQFASFSRILLHLEAGICASDTDVNTVDDLAFRCYQYKQYSSARSNNFPYHCPDCRKAFRYLSALFQHVETTPDCNWLLNQPNSLAKLEHFIFLQVSP